MNAFAVGDPQLFWTIITAVGQALGALATAAAVIVSLWIVLSERKPKLRIRAGMRIIFAGDGTPAMDAIGITIANVGHRRCRCTAIGWRSGYFKRGPEWLRRRYALQNVAYLPGSAMLPIDLEPGDEQNVILDPQAYLEATGPEKREAFFCRKLPWADSPAQTRIDIFVSLAAHGSIFQRVESGLAQYLATGELKFGASRLNIRAGAG